MKIAIALIFAIIPTAFSMPSEEVRNEVRGIAEQRKLKALRILNGGAQQRRLQHGLMLGNKPANNPRPVWPPPEYQQGQTRPENNPRPINEYYPRREYYPGLRPIQEDEKPDQKQKVAKEKEDKGAKEAKGGHDNKEHRTIEINKPEITEVVVDIVEDETEIEGGSGAAANPTQPAEANVTNSTTLPVDPTEGDIAMVMEVANKFDSHCQAIDLIAAVDDILRYSVDNSKTDRNGRTTLWFPVYDAHTLKIVGTYSDASTLTHEDNECVTNGLFSFDYDDGLQKFHSSITVASSCATEKSAITGGTGQFACATGYQSFYDGPGQGNIFIRTVLYVCTADHCVKDAGY